jgi:hypothetical protein
MIIAGIDTGNPIGIAILQSCEGAKVATIVQHAEWPWPRKYEGWPALGSMLEDLLAAAKPDEIAIEIPAYDGMYAGKRISMKAIATLNRRIGAVMAWASGEGQGKVVLMKADRKPKAKRAEHVRLAAGLKETLGEHESDAAYIALRRLTLAQHDALVYEALKRAKRRGRKGRRIGLPVR